MKVRKFVDDVPVTRLERQEELRISIESKEEAEVIYALMFDVHALLGATPSQRATYRQNHTEVYDIGTRLLEWLEEA
jgi:hypothetical protein